MEQIKVIASESEEETVHESFTCCVCLDLLYKPVVLACGHVCCFWCVRTSMNGFGDSKCPICRHKYHHFPSICQVLHFLIVKIYPQAYRRRENQILEGEKKMNCFSPQLKGSSMESSSRGGSALSSAPCSEPSTSLECSKLEASQNGYQLQDDSGTAHSEENGPSQANAYGAFDQISVTDVQCPACKEMLFRPVVLNCGHAYCENCINLQEDESIICQTCECSHPSDYPKVCLGLSSFLEEAFPKEYVSLRGSIECKKVGLQQRNQSACSSSRKSVEKGPIHLGFGCDYCGLLPIIGDRYRCKDCKEAIGFDLCAVCYNTQSKLPGRFNQQHTADHRFELIKNSNVIIISADANDEDPEEGSTPTRSNNAPGSAQENTQDITNTTEEQHNNAPSDP